MAYNREIGRLFNLFAELLLLHGKDERLAGLLSGAAYRIPRLNEEVFDLSKARLKELFRPAIIRLVVELRASGTIAALDELVQLTPPGLFDMMRVRGLGGKKLSILWKKAKIDSIDALLEAAKANLLIEIPGFGAKTQANIITAIEAYRNSASRFHFASVADTADVVVKELQKIFRSKLVSLCGEVRRQATTVSSIEIVAAVGIKKLSQKNLGKSLIVQSSNSNVTKGHTVDEIPVTIYHVTKENFNDELFRLTGSEGHVKKVRAKIKDRHRFSSEQAIYTAAKLPFIEPELREDIAEWNFRKRKEQLVELSDIKGVVHNHTDWSDGVDSLADFVNACKQKGFEYTVISDHSKNAHYAGGLKEEKVLRQLEQIDLLNRKVKPFHIFKSIECDIRVSGDLDYDASLLKQFDLVIVSIHQLLKMDEEKATRRLIKAIENPFTTILGHMTGRQLLIRPGYPVNFSKVIDACAANRVVIELNANPYRLDMDWSHIPYALDRGVMISIDPDAHSIAEIDNIRWGVSAARKGGLTKSMTWNALTRNEIIRWLKSH
ncbi:MAG: DNA polymerase/3'-5' exonuclease PolX [Niastella sp.]|uniref:DNA polymerase/3'-5' exonuclease PolX n=1 Tax=Niastella sp. TaxID=1869183 RepID=UPI00389A0EC6